MKRPLLRRLWEKLRPAKAKTPEPNAPAKPTHRAKKPTHSSFEPLEGRIAPAVVLNATTVQYQDVDGDLVTVKFSKPLFNLTGTALNERLDDLFIFDTGNARTAAAGGNTSTPQKLLMLDIDALAVIGTANPAEGTSITIAATKQGTSGNGLVNVGYIRAANSPIFGTTLGDITIDGDLGQIDAGDPNKAAGVKSLTVQTFGAAGLSSQGTNGSLESNISGPLGKLVVKGDFIDATLKVTSTITTKSTPKIGSITIGGSLLTSDGNTSANAAQISAADAIGNIRIGTTAQHGIFGGDGNNSAQIIAGKAIGSITISGDIRGGLGSDSALIRSGTQGMKNVTIGGSVWAGEGQGSATISTNGNMGTVRVTAIRGDTTFDDKPSGDESANIFAGGRMTALLVTQGISGGTGDNSANIIAAASLGRVSVGTSMTGGDGTASARIFAGSIGAIVIGGNLAGGDGDESARIETDGTIGSITISNTTNAPAALIAGEGLRSASIFAGGNLGPVIVNGALDGSTPNAGTGSANITTRGSLTSATINGALKGGAADLTGALTSDGTMGTVRIFGDVLGGGGTASAAILAGGKAKSITITGALDGGSGARSAAIMVGTDFSKPGDLGNVQVQGLISGDAGDESASIFAGGRIGKATLGGTTAVAELLKGGTGNNSGSLIGARGIGTAFINGGITGGGGVQAGTIQAGGTLTTLSISGAITGSSGEASGSILVRDIFALTGNTPGNLGTVTITGTVTGSTGEHSGSILVDGSANRLTLGALSAGTGTGSGSILTGRGAAALADDFMTIGGIASVVVRGALNGGIIDSGSRIASLTVLGAVSDAEIRTGRDLVSLTIQGDLTSSTITALGAVMPTAKADVAVGKIIISGNVSTTDILGGYDRFGNAANGDAQIGTIHVTGAWIASSLAAGVIDVSANGFGNADDIVIPSGSAGIIASIASITIGGNVIGSEDPRNHGFTAQHIGALRIGGILQPLTAGKDTLPIAGTTDVAIREVA